MRKQILTTKEVYEYVEKNEKRFPNWKNKTFILLHNLVVADQVAQMNRKEWGI